MISELEEGRHYFVEVDSARVTLVLAQRGDSRYLRTDPEATPANNLLTLPRYP